MQLEKESPAIIGRINRANVLHFIKENGPVSRADLSRMLGMSRSTISSIVEQLINDRRIREGATGQSTSLGGRRPVLLHYLSHARFALGIDIGGTKTIAVVTDLEGSVMARRKFLSQTESTPAMEHILSEITQFLAESGIARQSIVGTGIGFPGVTNPNSGRVIQAPGLQLENFHATEFFQALPGCVAIDNDVNMGVIGELWKGTARGHENVVLIALGTGIGAGLILNGKIYRGAGYYAGEIGHLHLDPFTKSPKLTLGDWGPLEQRASGKGIEDTARERFPQFPDTVLQSGGFMLTEVVQAALEGDKLASQVVSEALTYINFSIANMVTLLNPDIVILGGGVSQLGKPLLDAVQSGVASLSPVPCKIDLAGLGEDAAAFGSAATAFLQAGELRLSGFDLLPRVVEREVIP